MKKIITICAAIIMTASLWAQSPEKMSYQAVVRDGSNNLVTSSAVGMQISILQGSPSGTAEYVETQTPTTNANGLVSLEIGSGTVVSGDFTTINWANGPYFIKTETDPTGGTNYTITGTSQLLSVPYALHAKTAETITGTITETDPIFGASVASGITGADTTNWNNKLDSYTETDPIFGASVASGITGADTTNWNNKLDSYTETDPIFGASVASGITGADTTNWNNKLDSYTETDPIFGASVASGITGADTTNWNNKLDSYTETDPIFGASVASGITGADTTNWNNKLDSYTETDPIFGASVASGITGTDTTNWNNKLDSYTETDPIFGASVASGITGADTTNWNNKLDSYTETDPIFGASVASGITGADTTYWNNKLDSYTETDPIFGASVASGITGADTTYWNNKLDSYTETDPIFGASVASGITGADTTNWNNKQNQLIAGSNITITGNTISATGGSTGFTHYIGELYGGGIVVAVWKESGVEKGLIASLTDVSASAQYSSITNTLIGTTSPIDGQANTTAIVAQGDVSGAAYLCANYSSGGFNDWYLPAAWELNQCYNAAFVVNTILGATNGFQFANYWSSTETSTSNAWTQYFTSGYTNFANKGNSFRVRAVRRF